MTDAPTKLNTPSISVRGISSDSFYVEWGADPLATGYVVAYKEEAEESYTTIDVSVSETSLVLSGLAADTNYYVKVMALGDGSSWTSSSYCEPQIVKTNDAAFLSSSEYDDLRDRYNELALPESLGDVNIIVPTNWTAEAIIAAIEVARSTPIDDIILLEPERYSYAPLDLSNVSITLDVDYETSGAISILSRGMDRVQIKVNDSDVTFDAVAGLTQFGGFDFVDVNPEVAVYQTTVAPAMGTVPATIGTQSVGMYTPAGISVKGATKNFVLDAPTVSANPRTDDYALLFVGSYDEQNNLDEFYVTLKDYYFELVQDFSLNPANIYILYADGDTSGTSYNRVDESGWWLTTSDMTFAVSTGATVRAATETNLTLTLAELAGRMTEDSHLLFYTEDHGDGEPGARTDYNDYLCAWGEEISGTQVRDALFQIQQGYVTCVFTQCFSGGILDDIFDLSTGTVSSRYTGSAHFVGGAAANHYEFSLFNTNSYGDYIGYPQTFEEALRNCTTGVDAFIYTEQNDPFAAAYGSYSPNQGTFTNGRNEHPWHIGESFSIFAPDPIPDPVNLTLTLQSKTSTSITVNWSEVQGATSYTLEYVVAGASDEDAVSVVITPENSVLPTTYTAPRLTPATNYVFRVKADNSNYSNSLSVWTNEPEPESTSTVVTTDLDVVNAYDNLISLREAVSKYSVAGDTITFAPNLQGKTIKLDSSRGSLYVTKSLTIDASNLYDENARTPGLKISGEDAAEIMHLVGGKSLLVKGVEFTHGYSSACGGAIWNSGDLTVENCVFSDNNANDGSSFGGAIAVKPGATLNASSSYFTGNIGAGVVSFQSDFSDSYFTDCVFEYNDAISIYDMYGAVSMLNCIVKDNSDSGIVVSTNGRASAVNCLIVGNTAYWGAGLELYGDATLFNCTITDNTASYYGGGVDLYGTAVLNAYNTIIAGNTARYGGVDVYLSSSNSSNAVANARNTLSSFSDWKSGENNLTYNASQPLFKDAANGDYTLMEESVAIDAGNVDYVPAGVTTDLLGRTRVKGNGVDLGAYEDQRVVPLPTPTIAVTPGINSAEITWDAVLNASGYTLYYKKSSESNWTVDGNISASSTSITVDGLDGATQYDFKLVANGDGIDYADSASSAVVTVIVKAKLLTPTIVVTPGINSAEITWDAVQNATRYTLFYKKSSESSWTVHGDISSTNVTVANLDGATRYDFQLVANGDGTYYVDSDPSDIVTVIIKAKLETPTITVTPGINSAEITWNAVEHSSDYTLYYKKSSDSDWTPIDDISSTNITVDNLEGATPYDFKLVANGDGTYYVDSDPSAVVTKRINVKLDAPTIIGVDSGLDSISVSWESVANAVKYSVSYAPSGTDDWSTPETVENATEWTKLLSFASQVLSDAKTFRVSITAVAAGGDLDSDPTITTVSTKRLAAPVVVSKSSSGASIAIVWNSVDYALGYTVEYRVDGTSDWSPSASPESTTWNQGGLLPETTYEIRLVATAGDYRSAETTTTVTTSPAGVLPAPTITVTPGINSAEINWDAVQNVSGYTLYYKKSNESDWTPDDNISSTSATVGNLDGATPYDFKLVANGDGIYYLDSAPSAVVTAVISEQLAPAPTITVTPGVNSAEITWDAIERSSDYTLYYKKSSDSDWIPVDGISSTNITVDDLEGATSYDFKLVAHGDGTYYVDSTPSTVVSGIVKAKLETPTITVEGFANAASVRWALVGHASDYTLYYKKSSEPNWSDDDKISTSSGNIMVENLDGAALYDFKVVANGDGTYYVDSNESSVVTKMIKTPLDSPTITVTPGINSAEITWNAVEHASGYRLIAAYDDPVGGYMWRTLLDDISSEDTSVTLTDLYGATQYVFKLVAEGDETYWESASNETPVIIREQLEAPTITTKTPDATSITLNWTAVDNRLSYKVEYKLASASDWDMWSDTITATSTQIPELEPGTNYAVRVTALGDGTYYVNSEGSEANAKTLDQEQLSTPVISSVNPGVNKATVNWNAVDNASGYTVYWKKSSETVWPDANKASVSASSRSYPINSLVGATSYDFKVVANGDGVRYLDSLESAVVTKVIQEQLSKPTGLQVTDHTDKSISVKWNAVAKASGYIVEYAGGGQTGTITVSSNSTPINGLNPTTQYTIRVKAKGDGTYYVDSDWSDSVSQTTKETASVVVNSTNDVVNEYDGQITLREALTTYRAQGTTVTFASSLAGKTITLNSPIALSQSVTINASALSSPVTINGYTSLSRTRIFSLSGTNQTFTINKVNFTGGSSQFMTGGDGGAIQLTGVGAKLFVTNCAFTDNYNALGGAIYVGECAQINATNCTFTGNVATLTSGGAICLYGIANLNNCAFTNNTSSGSEGDDGTYQDGGGAVYVGVGAALEATGCTFTSNSTSAGRGGAVHAYGGTANFTACSFQNNSASGGGAIAYSNDSGSSSSQQGSIINSLFVKNNASVRGGGVALFKNANVVFTNDTIAKNSATQSGSGVYVWNSSSKGTFNNCIIVENSQTTQSGHNNIGYHTACNVYGYKTLTKNVTWKPSGNNLTYDNTKALFVNVNSNWQLASGSQALNQGNDARYSGPATDLAGNTRKVGTIDLGCYERQNSSALLDEDAELFEEMEDSLDLIAESILDL